MIATELLYRKAAANGATGLDLLIALYDTLAGDLRRASEAERSGDIEKRCESVNHALLVVAHLEEWVNRGSGGQLARTLTAFYSSLRSKMIEAQVKRSPQIFEEQMMFVLDVRRSWQETGSRGADEMERGSAPSQELLPWVESKGFRGNAPASSEPPMTRWWA